MIDLALKINESTVGFKGERIKVFWRDPENEEITAFNASLFKRDGNKIVNTEAQALLTFGKLIIKGFEKGPLGYEGKVFASDKSDQDYRDDWKELLCTDAAPVVMAVADKAFRGTSIINPDIDVENFLELFGEGKKETDPLEVSNPMKSTSAKKSKDT